MFEHFPKVPSHLQCACCIVATSTSRHLIFWCRAAWPKCIWPEKALWQDHFGTGHVSTVGKRMLIQSYAYLHQILEACHTQELQQRAHSPLQWWFLSHESKLRQPFRKYCPLRFALFQFFWQRWTGDVFAMGFPVPFHFSKSSTKKMAPFTLSKCTHLRFYKSKFPDMDRRLVQFQAWHNFIKVLWFPTRWTRTVLYSYKWSYGAMNG